MSYTYELAQIINTQSATPVGSSTRQSDTRLYAINIVKALTGTCVIAGFKDQSGSAQNITIPVGGVGLYDFGGIMNTAGQLTVTCSNAADALNVIVRYAPN